MKLRLTIIMLLLFAVASNLTAQQAKVLERSAKSVPDWLSSQQNDYIVVEVEAPNMSAAKDKAIEELSTRIIMSVAANVVHSSFSEAKVEEKDGKLSESESFGFSSKIAAANIPFIKGISLTDAKDSYWEKCREKKTDRIFYRYAVLYPFSQTQLEKMRNEFEAADKAKSDSLAKLKGEIDNVRSSKQIEQSLTELSQLSEYFFDDVRRKEAEGLLKNYKQLYKGLTLKAERPKSGKFNVYLMLEGRPFEVTGVPTLKSNCCTRLQATPLPDGYGYEISYDDTDCLSDEDNWIEISLRMRDTKITRKVYL